MALKAKTLLDMIVPGTTRSVTSLVRQSGAARPDVVRLVMDLNEQEAVELVYSGRSTSVRRPRAAITDPVIHQCMTPTNGVFASTLTGYDAVMRRLPSLSMLARRQ
ncbi:hypothetical protein [Burkholderia territorii]|uniref:hypothetical protein n=1 Tax=Burkholderia territorii TaxID=1503055 RepID=UPI000A68BD83|nr:hypothetical protein [Burkholderia territorii]